MPEEKQPDVGNSVVPADSSEPQPSVSPSTSQGVPSNPPANASDNRTELVSRARAFLLSPQIQEQEASIKRTFLIEKGLNESEINSLLRELPVPRPVVPPRTYPQQPPSNLPNLLVGFARLFSWIAGSSAVLILIYHRFLLPRIAQTSLAQRSIKSHHLSLMRKLTTSLISLKELQAKSFADLPRPDPYKELVRFATCVSVADVLKELGNEAPQIQEIPPLTLLRCGIEDFGRGKNVDSAKPTTEELFEYLEGQIPWLVSEDGLQLERKLWEFLSTCPLFTGDPPLPTPTDERATGEEQKPTRWTYTAPNHPSPSPLLESLTALSYALPRNQSFNQSAYQHVLQSLSDFTGYISTQIYAPYRLPTAGIGFLGSMGSLSPAEEELRKEIRALKGLVLNRRSFMPTVPRPDTTILPRTTQ